MKLTDDIFRTNINTGEIKCTRCGLVVAYKDIHLKKEQEQMDHDTKIRDFMKRYRDKY